jgi:tricorn protease
MPLRVHLHLLLFICALLCCSSIAQADGIDPNRPLWLRYPAVSPDGSRIAFSHSGQIWVVPTAGGQALSYTNPEFYSSYPVWSPDGRHLVFASKRHGNLDLFAVPADGGGTARRLTWHSSDDIPYAFSADSSQIYFSSNRLGDATVQGAAPPNAPLTQQLYSVPVAGGRERLIIPTSALDVAPDQQGRYLLYTSLPGFEQPWRKHAQSAATRDIWAYDLTSGAHRRLTDYRGEDRNAVWSPDGTALYYLSERSGSFNIWRHSFYGTSEPVQITFHKHHPVRFLTASRTGLLVYSYNGELWRLDPAKGKPERVSVRISQSSLLEGSYYDKNISNQATSLTVSPNGKELAVIAHGEIFAVSTLTGKSRRITSTPHQERSVSFGSDGRSLVYASEKSGVWGIYETRLIRPEDQLFLESAAFAEQPLVVGSLDAFAPRLSPDGTRLAYLEDRKRLRVLDRSSGKSKTVFEDTHFYMYTDDDSAFVWSPDSRRLLVRSGNIISGTDILLVSADGSHNPINLSQSGYNEYSPGFSADGKSVLWMSDRNGLRDELSKQAQTEVFQVFLSAAAFEQAKLSPEELLLQQTSAPGAPPTRPDISTPEQIDTTTLRYRTRKATPFSTFLRWYALAPDNRTLIALESRRDGGINGYLIDHTETINQLFTFPQPVISFAADSAMQHLFFSTPQGIARYHLPSKTLTPLPFQAEISWSTEEVTAIFDHLWRLTATRFYEPTLHGTDWKFYGQEYRKFLPYLTCWEEFAELLSEMVGELNASHTGSVAIPRRDTQGDKTASLGLYYDHNHQGSGVKVAAVLAGGPAHKGTTALGPGAIINKVDGVPITPRMDLHALLNRKAGKKLFLEVQPAKGGTAVQESIVPVTLDEEQRLGYDRWVEQNRALVDRLSGGRIGYVHINEMELPYFQSVFSELMGRQSDKEAVLLDVRYNTGGNIHDPLIALLTGTRSGSVVRSDGKTIALMPYQRWTKPSALLANASSYSDGMIFPYYYQTLKLGPVIGEPIPGSGTAVLWELQQGGRLVYGIPQLGFKDRDGTWLEKREVVPDIPVFNEPASVAAGRDLQLEQGVQALLKRLTTGKNVSIDNATIQRNREKK